MPHSVVGCIDNAVTIEVADACPGSSKIYKSNTIMAVLGHNSDPNKRARFSIPQELWIERVFSGTHGSYWDKDGNLYVQDWNESGRIMKLVRVK